MPSREERERVALAMDAWYVLKGVQEFRDAAALLRADAERIEELETALHRANLLAAHCPIDVAERLLNLESSPDAR